MQTFHAIFAIVALVVGVLACVPVVADMRREPGAGHGWFLGTIVAFLPAVIPFEPFGFDYETADMAFAWRIPVVLVVVLPAMLLHLVASMSGRGRAWIVRACDALTVGVVAWLLAMPTFPGPNFDSPPWWYSVGFGVYLLQFLVVAIVAVHMLVTAARGATGAARMRGILLAVTLTTFSAGYLLWFAYPAPRVELATSWICSIAAICAWVAMRAPRRAYDLLPHDRIDPYHAIEGLVSSANVRDELPDVLTTIATEWGLLGLAAVDVGGTPVDVVGSCSLDAPAARMGRVVRVHGTHATLGMEAWTTPLTPPLRRGDRERLTMLAHLIALALAREATARREHEVDIASQDVDQRLFAAHEQLRRADEIRKRGMRVVARDLRPPIQTLLSLTDSLETRWNELPCDQLHPLQQLVARQVARLAAVVDRLLVLASIEDGSLRSAAERVDVQQLVESVLASGIDARVQFHDVDSVGSFDVRAEPIALREIITQLLDNAAIHGSTDIEVLVSSREDVLIEVRDHGPGVRDEFAPLLFDRYTRDTPETERGLGLGLAIVRELTESLGGSAGHRRDDQQRTVFWLRLPRVEG